MLISSLFIIVQSSTRSRTTHDVIQPNRNIDREQISLSLPCPQTPRSALIRIIVGPVPAVSPLAVWWRLDPVAVWPHISQLTLAPWAGCGLPITAWPPSQPTSSVWTWPCHHQASSPPPPDTSSQVSRPVGMFLYHFLLSFLHLIKLWLAEGIITETPD